MRARRLRGMELRVGEGGEGGWGSSTCASALQAPSTLLLYTVFRVGGWKKKRRMYSCEVWHTHLTSAITTAHLPQALFHVNVACCRVRGGPIPPIPRPP